MFSHPVKARRRKRRVGDLDLAGTALIAAVGLLLGPLALASSASAATKPHATTPVLGAYVSVTPFRLVDTRTGATILRRTRERPSSAHSLNVQVTGRASYRPDRRGVLNVTATNTTQPGFPDRVPRGEHDAVVSNLNFTALRQWRTS